MRLDTTLVVKKPLSKVNKHSISDQRHVQSNYLSESLACLTAAGTM